MALTATDYKRIVEIGSELLSCRDFADLRSATMRCLTELASARAIVSFLGHPSAWRLDNSQRYGCDRRFVSDYVDMYQSEDPIVRQTEEYWHGGARRPTVFKSSEFMTDDVLNGNVIYQRLLKPVGLRQTICLALPLKDGSFLTFSALRPESAGDFSTTEMDAVWTLVPFLQNRCDSLSIARSCDYLKNILDFVSADPSVDGFAVFDSRLQCLYATCSGKGTLARICRDISRPDGQHPAFRPDLRETCRRFLSCDNRRPLEVKVLCFDPSASTSMTNVVIAGNRVNGETLLFLHVLLQRNSLAAARGADDPSLSERQRTVAGLVAQGLTNRQIAAHLSISASTVANHVSSILTRSGVSERSQLMHRPGILLKVEDLPLARRQRQILIARLCGLSTRATARRFHLRETTVRSHVRAICRKLGVSGMRGVVRYLNEKDDRSGNGGLPSHSTDLSHADRWAALSPGARALQLSRQ